MLKKIRIFMSLTVIITFMGSSIQVPVYAQDFSIRQLPVPGTMVTMSPNFEPALIKGLSVHKDNPFLFDFIVDPGQADLSQGALKEESDRMIKYFFAALTIPDKDVWVNLSPFEKNRMVSPTLGVTAMGRDLLAQDYMLKQLTASLLFPQAALGKKFWDTVYAQTKEKYGTTQVAVNTFNKVWIVPQHVGIYEKGQTAFIVDGHMKVMLEEDYLSLQKHSALSPSLIKEGVRGISQGAHSIGSQIMKEIILPEIEKEINDGKNFATLRQIFYAQALAVWFKHNLKQALLNRVYSNKGTVKGIDQNDMATNESIYSQYLKAYKKGVFNYIKEEIDPATQEAMPRKYFSGGYSSAAMAAAEERVDLAMMPSTVSSDDQSPLQLVSVLAVGYKDAASLTRRVESLQGVLGNVLDGLFGQLASLSSSGANPSMATTVEALNSLISVQPNRLDQFIEFLKAQGFSASALASARRMVMAVQSGASSVSEVANALLTRRGFMTGSASVVALLALSACGSADHQGPGPVVPLKVTDDQLASVANIFNRNQESDDVYQDAINDAHTTLAGLDREGRINHIKQMLATPTTEGVPGQYWASQEQVRLTLQREAAILTVWWRLQDVIRPFSTSLRYVSSDERQVPVSNRVDTVYHDFEAIKGRLYRIFPTEMGAIYNTQANSVTGEVDVRKFSFAIERYLENRTSQIRSDSEGIDLSVGRFVIRNKAVYLRDGKIYGKYRALIGGTDIEILMDGRTIFSYSDVNKENSFKAPGVTLVRENNQFVLIYQDMRLRIDAAMSEGEVSLFDRLASLISAGADPSMATTVEALNSLISVQPNRLDQFIEFLKAQGFSASALASARRMVISVQSGVSSVDDIANTLLSRRSLLTGGALLVALLALSACGSADPQGPGPIVPKYVTDNGLAIAAGIFNRNGESDDVYQDAINDAHTTLAGLDREGRINHIKQMLATPTTEGVPGQYWASQEQVRLTLQREAAILTVWWRLQDVIRPFSTSLRYVSSDERQVPVSNRVDTVYHDFEAIKGRLYRIFPTEMGTIYSTAYPVTPITGSVSRGPGASSAAEGQRAVEEGMLRAARDKAALAVADYGGIDLSQQDAAMHIQKDANGGVKVDVDPALIARVEHEGMLEVVPVIINIKTADMQSLFSSVESI